MSLAETHHAPVALGLDGGGGSLKWALRSRSGEFTHGFGPGANLQLLGWDPYFAAIVETIDNALIQQALRPDDLSVLGLGLSGVDRPTERQRLTECLRARYSSVSDLWIGNDALPALRQGAGRLAGVLVIAGTGSICVGARPLAPLTERTVEVIRVGGWGSLLGDEGSAYQIGRDLLLAMTRQADGRSPRSPLLKRVCNRLGLTDPFALIPQLYGRTVAEQRTELSGLAPMVFDLAGEGDRDAEAIIARAAQALVELAVTCLQRVGGSTGADDGANAGPCILHGGLFAHHPDFAQTVTLQIVTQFPGADIRLLTDPAALGAIALAEEQPVVQKSLAQ